MTYETQQVEHLAVSYTPFIGGPERWLVVRADGHPVVIAEVLGKSTAVRIATAMTAESADLRRYAEQAVSDFRSQRNTASGAVA